MPSTVISTMQYNPESSTLKVIFVSGMIYEYQNVPLEKYEAMRISGSKGKFLNKYIKGYQPFKRINNASDDMN